MCSKIMCEQICKFDNLWTSCFELLKILHKFNEIIPSKLVYKLFNILRSKLHLYNSQSNKN